MGKISLLAALSLSCVMATSAMAQIVDNNIPAGTRSAILSGTPSGTSVGSAPRSSVPPVLDTAPVTGRSSSCSAGAMCQVGPMGRARARR